jgi:hypothetical protein
MQSELLGCRTLEEVRAAQSRFFRTAIDQYAAEASQMMRLGTEAVSRSMSRGVPGL